MRDKSKSIKAQVTPFLIIGILIIVVVLIILIFGDNLSSIPEEVSPIYSYYLSCINEIGYEGSLILGQQGGYIEKPDFESGNEYMPFSSELDFLGTGVPYWFYVSGNGILKENIPSKEKMENQLNEYIRTRISECDFSDFEEQGSEIIFNEPIVKTKINKDNIDIEINQDLVINYKDISWKKSNHNAKTDSKLGRFYDLSKDIYLREKETMFLENYGIDILRLYAPVDGVEITCSPQIWNLDNVRKELILALEGNIPHFKLKGDYYSLTNELNKYFITDLGKDVNVNVNFLYLKDWPMKLEVWPSEDDLLIANPVGLQEGLGMLGFCYVPYHFVYDFAYPVMIQIYENGELFQFPMVVYIEKNQARESEDIEGLPNVVPELCEYKLNKMNIYTYDNKLNPIESSIQYNCFNTQCYIGKTEIKNNDAVLKGEVPQCVNGIIIARAEGYETGKILIEDVNKNSIDILLNKKYNLDLEVNAEKAIITFTKGDKVITVNYPEQKQIELSSGDYNIKVYSYINSSITLQGSKTEKCVEVPKSGVLGVFGLTEDKCFTLEIPSQVISYAVSGGGNQDYYVADSELENSNKILINIKNFDIPRKVEDLQENYNKVEINDLDINFI